MSLDQTTTARIVEQRLLTAMMHVGADVAAVAQVVDQDSFSTATGRLIFEGVLDLHKGAKPTDSVSLADWLHQRGYLEDVGGYTALAELFALEATGADAVYLATRVRDYAVHRRLAALGARLLHEFYYPAGSAAQALDDLQGTARSLSAEYRTRLHHPEERDLHDHENEANANVPAAREAGAAIDCPVERGEGR